MFGCTAKTGILLELYYVICLNRRYRKPFFINRKKLDNIIQIKILKNWYHYREQINNKDKVESRNPEHNKTNL